VSLPSLLCSGRAAANLNVTNLRRLQEAVETRKAVSDSRRTPDVERGVAVGTHDDPGAMQAEGAQGVDGSAARRGSATHSKPPRRVPFRRSPWRPLRRRSHWATRATTTAA